MNSSGQQKKQQQQEDRLCNLLSSIGHLSEHGEVPVYAFGTLISTAPPQAIAEHLHQRWLADPHFAKIAPKIVLQMSTNVTVCSQVLSFALRDFNTRYDIRAQSKGMFRNFVRTLVELYPVYRKIDKCLSACLIEPLFRCLQMLVEEDPDDRDLHCISHIVVDSGQQLSQLNCTECDRLILSCRRWLCSNRVLLEEETRRLLMNAIDLWTYSWDRNLFPDCLRRFYDEMELEEKSRKHLLGPKGQHPFFASAAYERQFSNIPASYSSQQMTDSASSSLPSSAMALDTQTTMTTKSLPQSQASLATLGGGCTLPISLNNTIDLVLPNGDLQHHNENNVNMRRRLSRSNHVEEEMEESDEKESTI